MTKSIYLCYVVIVGISVPMLLNAILDYRLHEKEEKNKSTYNLHKFASAVDKNLPRKIDEITWLESAFAEETNIVFDLRFLVKFTNLTHQTLYPGEGQFDYQLLQESVRSDFVTRWCSNEVLLDYILKLGGGVKYRYLPSTRENSLVYSFTVHDCPGIGVPAVDYSRMRDQSQPRGAHW